MPRDPLGDRYRDDAPTAAPVTPCGAGTVAGRDRMIEQLIMGGNAPDAARAIADRHGRRHDRQTNTG